MEYCLGKKNAIQKNTGIHVDYRLTCYYDTFNCYYVVDCFPVGQQRYECKKLDHFIDYLGFCCDYIC